MTAAAHHRDHSRIIAVVAGAVLLRLGFGFKTQAVEAGGALGIVAVLLLYGVGLACLASAVSSYDPARYSRPLAYLALYAVLVAFVVRYGVALATEGEMPLGADAILYSQYAADLLLAGENPYAASMLPAFDRYPIDPSHHTALVDGGIVETYSYPALSILVYVPQRLLGIPNANMTTFVVFVATLLFLVRDLPREYGLAPIAVLFATPNLLNFSTGGVFDIVWALPLLLAMRAWSSEQWRQAAVWTGLAFAVKQTPWLIGPFLAIGLYREAPTRAVFVERARACIGWGLGAFLLPNLPFILWDPVAWLHSLDRATGVASTPMVADGAGLVLVRTAGGLDLPRLAFVGLLLAWYGWLLAVYAYHYDRVQWLAWIVPAIALFVHYRSLHNYFLFIVPVAFYAIVLQLREHRRSAAADRDQTTAGEVLQL